MKILNFIVIQRFRTKRELIIPLREARIPNLLIPFSNDDSFASVQISFERIKAYYPAILSLSLSIVISFSESRTESTTWVGFVSNLPFFKAICWCIVFFACSWRQIYGKGERLLSLSLRVEFK